MNSPADMPKKLPEGLKKLTDEQLEANRAQIGTKDPWSDVEKRKARVRRKKEREARTREALHGLPLKNFVESESRHRSRRNLTTKHFERSNRERRPRQ